MVDTNLSRSSSSIIGYDAPKLVEYLIRSHPEIEMITLFRPPLSRPIQRDPSIGVTEQALIAEALTIRERLKLPFWDSLFLYLSSHPANAQSVLKRATLHNPQDFDSFRIFRDNCTETRLREIIEDRPDGRIVAMSSRVLTKQGKVLHLPMLDFHCLELRENDALAKAVVTEIGLEGYIAKSGTSYHFYGRTLVDEQSLITILGNSLLFCPIIDRAWIAHQLLERACGLRISPGKDYQTRPEVICEV